MQWLRRGSAPDRLVVRRLDRMDLTPWIRSLVAAPVKIASNLRVVKQLKAANTLRQNEQDREEDRSLIDLRPGLPPEPYRAGFAVWNHGDATAWSVKAQVYTEDWQPRGGFVDLGSIKPGRWKTLEIEGRSGDYVAAKRRWNTGDDRPLIYRIVFSYSKPSMGRVEGLHAEIWTYWPGHPQPVQCRLPRGSR